MNVTDRIFELFRLQGSDAYLGEDVSQSEHALQAAWLDPEPLPRLRHAFTHFELEITPLRARCQSALKVMEGGGALWYNAREPARIGLPAPIAALLSAVSCSGEG